jgi:hypothetical protein
VRLEWSVSSLSSLVLLLRLRVLQVPIYLVFSSNERIRPLLSGRFIVKPCSTLSDCACCEKQAYIEEYPGTKMTKLLPFLLLARRLRPTEVRVCTISDSLSCKGSPSSGLIN